MPDNETSTIPDDFDDTAARSQEAGIADETAAFDSSATKAAPPSIDEGDPATKDDGSGTSETD